MKGKKTVLEVQRQLARELRLPEGQENLLRLMSTGNGEISAIIERGDDTQRVRDNKPPVSAVIVAWKIPGSFLSCD